MNILDEIIAHKKTEVVEAKRSHPISELEKSEFFSLPVISLRDFVQRSDKTGIIAEFKRKSPSKGIINDSASVEHTTKGYANAGASALSVLTDSKFFGGSNEDLKAARKINQCPILRKDFTIDEYQIVEAKSIGADAILLIAAVLEPNQVKRLTQFAHSLKLEVLLEVHNEDELKQNLGAEADLIGVNNRNLKNFSVDVSVSKRLSGLIRSSAIKVSESGISSEKTIVELKQYGFEGFLMGENFMKHPKPEEEAKAFMNRLRNLMRVRG
jgi:indole-3-glycerol phosphate synthase